MPPTSMHMHNPIGNPGKNSWC